MNDSVDAAAAALGRARQAQPGWYQLGFRGRARALRRLAARARADAELPRLISEETGKPAFEALGFEVGYLCELTRFLSGRAGRRALGETRRSSLFLAHKRARVAWKPRGVVAVIGPFNFPLLSNFGDAVGPLLAGNAVVLKPSPHTPRTSLRMQTLWNESGLPAGVFQVAQGGAETARALVDGCDGVFFTGGAAAGRDVAARAGARLIPCVAELGGKSAMIVLGDADLEAAARAAVWGAFAGAGQICVRVERVLVEAVRGGSLRGSGGGADERASLGRRGTRRGPFAAPRAARALPGASRRCREPGRASPGRRRRSAEGVYPPTVLDHVPSDAAVAVEETFGPLLPIVRVSGAEEAIHLANASPFGLSGSVWSRNLARARAVARRLEAGSLCTNDVLVNYFFVSAPLGGMKSSGLGYRHGAESLRQFCCPQSIVEDRPLLGPLPAWIRRQLGFPYRQRVLRALRWIFKVLYR